MATGKRYYWIKLKTDFMTSDKVDYLMSQKNGAEYVVLYQMLCLKCINTDGFLARKIGEIIIPFDAEKIQRDCKYFNIDTVKEAFRLFIQLGMIYQEENGFLRIAEFENLVGSETDFAAQKRNQRNKELTAKSGQAIDNGVDNVHTELDIEKEIDKDILTTTGASSKPTPEEVFNFYHENKLEVSPERFWELNNKKKWKNGLSKNWKKAYLEMTGTPEESYNPYLEFNSEHYGKYMGE